MEKKLTKNDLENLANLPNGKWFEAIDVWPKVKRTDYSLRRLINAGYVQIDVRGDLPYVYYKKIKEAQ